MDPRPSIPGKEHGETGAGWDRRRRAGPEAGRSLSDRSNLQVRDHTGLHLPVRGLPQESRLTAETAGEAPVDDSDEWDYDPFIDPDAEPEPDEELTELPPSIQPRRQVAPAIPPPQTSPCISG